MAEQLYNDYIKSIEETEPNYHKELMDFYDKMFDNSRDSFCYANERNKIIVEYEDSLVRYEISTMCGDIVHMRIFEGDKLIDEALFIKNSETEEYEEFNI